MTMVVNASCAQQSNLSQFALKFGIPPFSPSLPHQPPFLVAHILPSEAGLVKKTHPAVRGSQRAPTVSPHECGSLIPSSGTWGIWLRRSIRPISTLTVLLHFLSHCPALLTLGHLPFLCLRIEEIFITQNNPTRSLGFSFEHHQSPWRWLAKKWFSLMYHRRFSKEASKVKWVWVGLIFRAF